MRRSFLLAAVFAIASGQFASAADMPTKAPVYAPAFNWNGFYVGADAGVLAARGSGTWTPLPSALLFGADAFTGDLNKTSFVGGIHGGYNWLLNSSVLLGVEADWSWTKNSASTAKTPWTLGGVGFPPLSSTTMSRDINWLASLRGRLGMLVTPNALVYLTGGVAWGGFNYGAAATNGVVGSYSVATSSSKTSAGYVLGGGVEWALTNNWLVRGEYLYYGMNSSQSALATSTTFPTNPSGFSWDNAKIHVGRVGLSYKF
jgi:outer membrane immunogenic protein